MPLTLPAQHRLAAVITGAALLAASTPAAAQTASNDVKHMTTLAAELATGAWSGYENADLQANVLLGHPQDTFLLRWTFQSSTPSDWDDVTVYLVPTGDREQLRSHDGALTIRRAHGYCVRAEGQIVTAHSNPTRPRATVSVAETFCPGSNDAVRTPRERYAGLWRTDIGDLRLAFTNGAILRGEFSRPDTRGEPAPYRRVVFGYPLPDGLLGAWSPMENGFGDTAELRLSADGQLTGRLWLQDGPVTFRGRRPEAETPPPAQTPPPSQTPAPVPVPGGGGGSQTPPPATGGFQPLGAFDVRFDRLERQRDSQVVRAVVTIRNASQQVQHLPSGTFRAILTDRDGAGQERNQLWRGSGEPAQVFNGTPSIQPGAELTVRFTFTPDIRDLKSLTLMRAQESASFDLSGR